MPARQRRWSLTLPALLTIGVALSGCSSSNPHFAGHAGNHHGPIRYQIRSYQVNGVWYYPKVDYDYDETGIASWYGAQFQGRPTSDGEIFDMNKVSAAHKTLPLPSVVEVTNLQNGRSLQLRVNDRGPFVDGRIIDLSRRAAQLLGYETAGTAEVRVKILKDESIQAANEVLYGQPTRVMVAQAPQVRRVASAVQTTRPMTPPRPTENLPPSLRAPVVIASTPRPNPPERVEIASRSASETRHIMAPEPKPEPPPPELLRMAAEPPVRLAHVERHHRHWPSLISQAHADTLHLPFAPPPVPAEKPRLAAAHRLSRIFVQAGAFAVPANAQRLRARIATLGSVEVVPTSAHGSRLYRVRLGPFANEAEAARLLSRLVRRGYPGARVVTE
jgi:rare lipoprotein A